MAKCSGEIWVLQKLATLADRCGVSPTIADIYLTSRIDDNLEDNGYWQLSAVDSGWRTPEEGERVKKVWQLLGLDEDGVRRFSDLCDAEEAVNMALDLAPRPRVR